MLAALLGTGCSGSDDTECDPPADAAQNLAQAIGQAANQANRADDPPRRNANPLSAIPSWLVPKGKTNYTAYVGLSWFLSKEWGSGSSTRTASKIELDTEIGSVTLEASGSQIVATMSDGKVLRGAIKRIRSGVEFRAKSGEVVEITIDGNVLSVDFEGFDSSAVNNAGLYLKRK